MKAPLRRAAASAEEGPHAAVAAALDAVTPAGRRAFIRGRGYTRRGRSPSKLL